MKVLLLSKDNCVPCQNVANWLNTQDITYDKIDVFDRPELAGRYKVRTVPTLIVLNEDNDIDQRTHGFDLDGLNILKNKLHAAA